MVQKRQGSWMARSIDPSVLRSAELNARIEVAETEFADFIHALVAERRCRPGDDLLSELVVASVDGCSIVFLLSIFLPAW